MISSLAVATFFTSSHSYYSSTRTTSSGSTCNSQFSVALHIALTLLTRISPSSQLLRVVSNGRSHTSFFWGKRLPAKISKHNITHKNQRYCTNHGRRRRPPMEAFRHISSHDITHNDVYASLLLGSTTWEFLLRLVLGG